MARLELKATVSSERVIFVSMSKHCWTLKDKYESQFSVSFYPFMLSNTKKAEILHRAEEIRAVRNEISEIVHNDMLRFQDMSKFSFQKVFNSLYNHRLSSHYLHKAIDDVWIAYNRRFKAIAQKIEFYKVDKLIPTFYKINTHGHHIGDLRSITCHTRKTDLTLALTWLAKHGNDTTIEWLKSTIASGSSKNAFYYKLLGYIQRFGFGRLMRLATSRRDALFKSYFLRGRIIFNSLTFHGRSRHTRPIVSLARKEKGKFNCYIELSWLWNNQGYHGVATNALCIPVKYSKAYHRSLTRYTHSFDTFYTMVITGKDIHIVLYRRGYRYKNNVEISDNNTIGIDVNSKTNMFTLSTGGFIANDSSLINEFIVESRKVDRKQHHYNSRYAIQPDVSAFKMSKTDKIHISSISRKLKESNRRTIVNLCKQLAIKGIWHIAMENLIGFKGTKLHPNDELGFNLGRLHKYINLSSLKDEFIHIAPKYGLSVSLVQPEYTSKMCGHCGCIDDRNRQTQEVFKCVECGHTENADVHSAKNIKFRLTSTVLRGYLFERARDNGYRNFQPKSLSRWQVREFLEKCRSSGLFSSS